MRLTVGVPLTAIRDAIRVALRQPGSSLVIVLTLAVGIGGNATMLGLAERLLLREPAHVQDPASVRRVLVAADLQARPNPTSSHRVLAALREHASGLTAAAAYMPARASFGSGIDVQPVRVVLVTGDFFHLLGVRPAVGRTLVPGEEFEAPRVAVLSHDFWRRRHSGDSSVVDRSLLVNGRAYRVVGVTPAGFTGVDIEPVDVFLPLAEAAAFGGPDDWRGAFSASWLRILVRRRPDVSDAIAAEQVTRALRAANTASGLPLEVLPQVARLSSVTAARAAERQLEMRMSVALTALAVAVFLSACANVAYLLFARTLRRRREIAVRIALGISRRRLLSELLLEAMVLAVAGGLLALGVVNYGGGFLRTWLLPEVDWQAPALDARTGVFTLALTVAAVVLTGLARAIRFSRPEVVAALRNGEQTSHTQRRLRRVLLASQAAFAMLAVSASALFVQTLRNVRAIDTGVELRRVLHVTASNGEEPANIVNERYEALAERARATPGMERTALVIRSVPLVSAYGIAIRVPGIPAPERVSGTGPYYSAVTNGFFETLGTRLVAGRSMTEDEFRAGRRVAVINATMARRWWEGASPLGHCLRMGSDSVCTEVVGVVQDVIKFRLLGEPEPQMLYVPASHPFARNKPADALLLRTRSDATSAASAVRRTLAEAVPRQVQLRVESYEEMIEPQVRPFRLAATVLTCLGATALLICTIGLYGLMSYTAAERRREFGIRRALGARTGDIVGMVLREGLLVVALGIVTGGVIAALAGRFVAGLVYGVAPTDPRVLLLASVILAAAAAIAGLWPAFRAVRVPPDVAIRLE